MTTPTEIPRAEQPSAVPDLIPVRMLNEFTYCPRLAYLEWVQGEFAESHDTLDGTFQHRRVDKPGGALPAARPPRDDPADQDDAGDDEPAEPRGPAAIHSRSVSLSSETEGLTAVMDLVEGEVGGDMLTPVDYKRGSVPDVPGRCWEPERVQLCAQGLILRANGYRCEGGVLYYVESRTRVTVAFDEELVQRTRELVRRMREMAARATIPPPLVDSPKCARCSLVGICLPDETRFLVDGKTVEVAAADDDRPPRVRLLIATHADGHPLYVQEQRGFIGKKGDVVQVRAADDGGPPRALAQVRMAELTHVCLFGNVQISTQLVHELCDRQVPIAYFSAAGYFHGITTGLPSKNIELRMRQYARAAEAPFCLDLARALTAGKIENQRTMLRRNYGGEATPAPAMALEDLRLAALTARKAESLASLLGVEGNAARVYFGHFAGMIRPRGGNGAANGAAPVQTTAGLPASAGNNGNTPTIAPPGPRNAEWSFRFDGRNRRPPADPVNALLSLGYSLLAKDLTVACWVVGLDPFLGYFHQVKYGRPALALDLMEEFRAIIVDSVVLTAINTGLVTAGDFVRCGPAVALRPAGRRRFIQAYERRLEGLVTHGIFGYRISYRRVLEVQARLLGRVLLGEAPAYVPFTTR